jgi:hypothetical protein
VTEKYGALPIVLTILFVSYLIDASNIRSKLDDVANATQEFQQQRDSLRHQTRLAALGGVPLRAIIGSLIFISSRFSRLARAENSSRFAAVKMVLP